MISFDTNEGRFNLRSAAVVIHDEYVLLHQAVGDDFWVLPGARVEFLETSRETVIRELREELGLSCRVVRQLWHTESFFEYNSVKVHELANYFLVSLTDVPKIDSEVDFNGIEESVELVFRWLPLDNIGDYNLLPRFLLEGLNNLPDTLKTIEINDISA
ncbi:NUDIX domain-containing protein [Aurantivibrio plasticivorans]